MKPPLVDDGSDQDFDSHIMVWQLPVLSEYFNRRMASFKGMRKVPKSHASSRTSSSLDLGPTPGSGIVTVDSDGDGGEEGEGEEVGQDALQEQESTEAEDSYSNWTRDVQSMINNVSKLSDYGEESSQLVKAVPNGSKSPGTALDRSTDRSKCTPSPREDFTQHLAQED